MKTIELFGGYRQDGGGIQFQFPDLEVEREAQVPGQGAQVQVAGNQVLKADQPAVHFMAAVEEPLRQGIPVLSEGLGAVNRFVRPGPVPDALVPSVRSPALIGVANQEEESSSGEEPLQIKGMIDAQTDLFEPPPWEAEPVGWAREH